MSRDGRLDLDDPQLNQCLAEAVGRFGTDLWTRPGLVRATLSDALGESSVAFRGEIYLLGQSADLGLARAVSSGTPTAPILSDLRGMGIDAPVAEQLGRVWDRAIHATASAAAPLPVPIPPGAPPVGALAATVLPDEPPVEPGPLFTTPPQPGPSNGAPPTPSSNTRLRLVITGVAVLIVVIAVAAFLALRSDDEVTTVGETPGGPTEQPDTSAATTPGTTPDTLQGATPNSTGATPPTTPVEPASPAAVRAFFGTRVTGSCDDYPNPNLASVICIVNTPGRSDHLTNFTSWGDVDSAVYAITHADAGETALATGVWTAPDGRTGATMDTVDTTSSYPYCRVWSYDGTEYTGEVCAADAAQLEELLPTYQL